MVTRRISIIEWLVAEPVGEAVYAKCGLLHEENAKDASIDEATEPVIPAKACHNRGQNESHENNNFQVMAMLPNDNRVFVQISNVRTTDPLRVLFHNHPSKMAIQQTLANRVGVLVGVGVSMMGPVILANKLETCLIKQFSHLLPTI